VESYLLQRSTAWAVEGLQDGPFAFKNLFLLDQQTLTSSTQQVGQHSAATVAVAEKQKCRAWHLVLQLHLLLLAGIAVLISSSSYIELMGYKQSAAVSRYDVESASMSVWPALALAYVLRIKPGWTDLTSVYLCYTCVCYAVFLNPNIPAKTCTEAACFTTPAASQQRRGTTVTAAAAWQRNSYSSRAGNMRHMQAAAATHTAKCRFCHRRR
jgi:hypothetical protein